MWIRATRGKDSWTIMFGVRGARMSRASEQGYSSTPGGGCNANLPGYEPPVSRAGSARSNSLYVLVIWSVHDAARR
jgi:hypothetical protein